MKKYTLLYILFALTLIGCENKGNKKESHDAPKPEIPVVKENIIHKDIFVASEFTHLTSVSGADIVYTQGDFHIEAVGDSAILQYLKTEFDSGVLTVNIGSERNPDINIYEGKKNITLNISAPKLQCVSLCSSGDFTSKGVWKGDKIELGIIGEGSFHCDSILCDEFDIKSTQKGDAEFAYISGKHLSFANLANTSIKANVDTDMLSVVNKGRSTMTFTGRATTHEFFPSKEGQIIFE